MVRWCLRCELKMPQIIWPEEARLSDASTKGVKRGGGEHAIPPPPSQFPSVVPPIHFSSCLLQRHGVYISINLCASLITVYLRGVSADFSEMTSRGKPSIP